MSWTTGAPLPGYQLIGALDDIVTGSAHPEILNGKAN